MGIGFTIDTPLKVAHYGIDSVISLVDDILIEKMRKFHCIKNKRPYVEIPKSDKDHRAKRITEYLNLMHDLIDEKFQNLKTASHDKIEELIAYFDLLPNHHQLKMEFFKLVEGRINFNQIKLFVEEKLTSGNIDVNIMTKVDREIYIKDEKLPVEYNDAHAALRGFANSKLNSSVVLSAGMNPRLYSYFEQFKDFYPNQNGVLNKTIILKVSDYRSALIQGKVLAKKGIWISEYRIESGLNCGGHAFATDGLLMGPILEEFRKNKTALVEELYNIYVDALRVKNIPAPTESLDVKITAQGGVGTAEEHEFLLNHYNIDSVGWGTPFLLVPEATNIDNETLKKLELAQEDDLYLSDISPLGVPFNNLKGNTKDAEKKDLIAKGRPGSSCPKKFVSLNTEFNDKGMCTASREYQHLKIKQLEEQNLSKDEFEQKYNETIVKSCTCVGLGTSALLANGLDTKVEGVGVSVCPGPNMAYFSKAMSLQDISSHIYGDRNMIARNDRPNMFVKELEIYLDFLNDKLENAKSQWDRKQKKYFGTFVKNLQEGYNYYQSLFRETKQSAEQKWHSARQELHAQKQKLEHLQEQINAKLNAA